ncbi:MAG: hypothetical protein IJI25_05410 [Eubacterium sp.]|nr:hypothetical protein [Eubacterium sp.]
MNKKKILIGSLIGGLVVALIGVGIWYWQRNSKSNTVTVYPVEALNAADYADYGSQLTGVISSDFVQQVIPDGSRAIKKVYVKKGQQVKKGDKLLKYNVDEQEIDVKLQKLQIESAKLQIAAMERQLEKLKNTKPVKGFDGGGAPLMQASLSMTGIKDIAFESLLNQTGKGTLLAQGEGEGGSGDNQGSGGEGGSGDNQGSETEDPLKAAREAAKSAIDGLRDVNIKQIQESSAADEAKTVDTGATNTVADNYKNQIDSTEITKEDEINSLRNQAFTELNRIAALQEKRDNAFELITKEFNSKKYNYYDSTQAEKIVGNATTEINKATTAEAITKLKADAITALDNLNGRYTNISEVDSQQAPGTGDGSSSSTPILYLLYKEGNTEPTVSGKVVNALFKDPYAGKYIQFRVYDSKTSAEASKVFAITPDSEIKGVINDSKNYTIPELESLIKTKEVVTDILLKALTSYTQHQAGKGTLKSKYKYYLKKNAPITGSVINNLISKNKYAVIRDYESDDAFAAGKDPINSITITPDTKFSKKISGKKKYTIRELNKLLVAVKTISVKPTRSGLRTVYTGNKYGFKATVTGNNVSASGVTWSVTNAKSRSTGISSGGILTVGSDETAAALKITASIGSKKGSYLVKVKKSSSSGGSSNGSSGSSGTGNDASGNDDITSYTAEELKEAIAEKEKDIADAKQELNEAMINYKEAKKVVDDAIVRATITGKVTLAYTAEEAPTDSPVVIVRADDGVYVKTSVSELNLDTVKVGGILRVTSYQTNESYEAEIKEIADYPSGSDAMDVSGNPNSSSYAVTAYIADVGDLNIGEQVEITYDSQTMGTSTGDVIYLPLAYVVTEGQRSYVYKADKEGRLKKSYVKTGRTISGQFVEITEGLTLDDKVAFAYDKKLREGAKTKISEDTGDVVW